MKLLYHIYSFLFCVSFIFGNDYFPPEQIPPTHSNAKSLDLINYFKNNDENRSDNIIISNYRDINQTRNELSKDDIAHLLRRTTFGARIEDIQQAYELGLNSTLNLLFTKNEKPIPEFNWIYHYHHPDFSQLSSAQKDSIRDQYELNFIDLKFWWLDLMKNSGINITEMMVLFWHDHFATSSETVKFTPSMYVQNQLLRQFATGNFKNLVKTMNYDPAMLEWLDNNQNYFINDGTFTFNENYARELLELFTMGEGNYSQFDIEEATRSLTGISSDGLMHSIFSPIRHDFGNKTILDVTDDIGVDNLIDLIFERQEPALFLSRKLYQWFVYKIPDEIIVEQMANIMVIHNYEIEPVLRALFASEHFYDINFRGSKYKSPVWFTLNTKHKLYIDISNNMDYILWYNYLLGQSLFYPPDVSGWDGYRSWINTYTLPYRKAYSNQIVDGYNNIIPEWSYVINFVEKFSDPHNPVLLLNEMLEYFLAIQPSQQTKDLLLEELLDGSEVYDWYLYDPGSESRIKTVIKHIMRLEEFQVR